MRYEVRPASHSSAEVKQDADEEQREPSLSVEGTPTADVRKGSLHFLVLDFEGAALCGRARVERPEIVRTRAYTERMLRSCTSSSIFRDSDSSLAAWAILFAALAILLAAPRLTV
jgi:hypothetical protein